ncbi:MAG: glycosyltransferase [Clostridia bacterium]|nr:glycosyltransferase [Clostridia bacterium]
MQYQPKVTIIIPVYNGSNFLAEAIEAALAQTYPNCEILVINDGSNDDGASEKIALSYGDKVRYYLKENGGVSSVLNYAFEKMTGEWFSWLSHDDLYYPEKIEKQIAFINELINKNPDLNIKKITVRTATESIDKNGKVIKTPSYKDVPMHEKPIDTILNNISNYRLSGCSFLLPAACIADVGGFNESIRTVSDVEYWYRLLFAGYEFYCLSSDILVKNRSHGKQVGKTKVELFNKELADLFIWIADTMNQNREFSAISNNERLYYALVKRKSIKAATYVKTKYLKNKVNKVIYHIKYPIYSMRYAIVGSLRNVARWVFRKMFVK